MKPTTTLNYIDAIHLSHQNVSMILSTEVRADQLTDRELELHFARKVGYYTLPFINHFTDTTEQLFILVHPANRVLGHGHMHGIGPSRKIVNKPLYQSNHFSNHALGYSPGEAMEWVPQFCSHPEHFEMIVSYLRKVNRLSAEFVFQTQSIREQIVELIHVIGEPDDEYIC